MPTLAETNRVGVRIVEEVTWGTTPTGPALLDLPYTSEALKSNILTVTSDTIRSDRNVSDITKVGGGAGGNIGMELRYDDFDLLLGGALQTSAIITNLSAAIASAHFSGGTITADSSALAAVVSGQHLRVTGASATANNGIYRVKGITNVSAGAVHTISVVVASTNAVASFTSDVFAAATKMQGKLLRNGTTARSFTIEKAMNDVSEFFKYAGMRVDTLNLNFEAQTILTADVDFLGKSQVASSLTYASAVTAVTGNDVMNGSGHVGNIWVNSEVVTSIYFKTLGLSLTNNLREQPAVGEDENIGIGSGRCEVTGTMNAYFEDKTLIDAYVNGTDGSIRAAVTDPDGNTIMVSIPKVRWTDGQVLSTGPNNDAMADMTWGAMINDGLLYAIQIDLLDA